MTDCDVMGEVRAELGESPLWDAGLVHWVDVWGGHVHTTDPASGETRSAAVGAPVSAVLAADDGGLLACRAGELLRVGGDRVAGGLARDGMRVNDAAAAPDGTLWFGTMGWTAADDRPGTLSYWDVMPRAARSGVALANGIAWSPDGSLLWFADSKRGTVTGYDATADTLGRPRTVITVEPGDGLPDGLCVDADGGIWVALFGGGAVRRYTPDGALLAHVTLPVSHPTSCAFGGDHLYVTTARRPAPRDPLAGALLRLRPGVRGVPLPRVRLDQFRRTA